jgi:hypothetical protein
VNPFRLKATGVGEYGTFILPLPKKLLDILGWKEGDELTFDIPTTYPDQIIVHKVGK